MLKLLHLNNAKWECSFLGEQALLLTSAVGDDTAIEVIHSSTYMLNHANIFGMVDIIPAYQSIALVYDRLLESLDQEISRIESQISDKSITMPDPAKHRLPVCYEMGLDWKAVEDHTGLPKDAIIKYHLNGNYIIAMMGFIPGFIYLSGLDKKIHCPRRENPRIEIPAGAVGIGGSQAGMYSLKSPGGWQIIGQTPHSFFNPREIPPVKVKAGDRCVFERITEAEFRKIREGVNHDR
ncbi:MAG: 5-oxoprolinase subunit PxpB [Balneolaceae bacterium]|nr:5-oxoprolinase subunit PxpB [Balneolaceae bacterium]